jgi:hypothetical protein
MAAFIEAILQQMQEQIAQMQTDLPASAAATATAAAAAAAATAALNALPPDGALPAGKNPGIPQQAPVFALLPALVNTEAFLDLNSISGAKLFKSGAQPLSQTFNFSDPSDLQVFLYLLKTKTRVQGWSRVFTVPGTTVGLTVNHNLLSNYGLIPLADVTQDVLSYVDTQTKVAQDLFMAFQCIFASLEIKFLKTINMEAWKYHVGQDQTPSGSLLLKAIIMRAHVDTQATVTFICEALSQLDVRMSAFDSNMMKFNIYVKSQVISLEARGESTNDLLVNVFKGYQMAQDEDFAQFVKRKKDAYDEGADITVASLMDAAEKTSTRLDSSLENGAPPLRNKSRSLPSWHKWINFRLQLLFRRTSRGTDSSTLLILRNHQ